MQDKDIAVERRPARHDAPTVRDPGPVHARWARDEADVRAAQRLRHEVFAGELGARLSSPRGTPPGLDVDLFDAHCEHLLACAGDRVVGSCRVLTPDAARRAGGLCAETAFDLTRLRRSRPRLMEAGRACVHPGWRQGSTVLALWRALADFMADNGLDTVIGCASVGMRDGGHFAADLWQQLAATHLASIEHRVRPRLPPPVEALASGRAVPVPPLLRACLRRGARLLGPPAWDPDFGTADLPLLLRLADLPAAQRRQVEARRFPPR